MIAFRADSTLENSTKAHAFCLTISTLLTSPNRMAVALMAASSTCSPLDWFSRDQLGSCMSASLPFLQYA